MHEIFGILGIDSILLTSFNDDTAKRFAWKAQAEADRRLRLPTVAELDAALDKQLALAESALKAGAQVHFYFYFSGHGRRADSLEGELMLHDGVFTRSQLYDRIIRRFEHSAAYSDFYPHVLIDACEGYAAVSSRGELTLEQGLAAIGAQRASTADEQRADRFPKMGFIVGQNPNRETYEFSDYEGGVFSRELHSAMLGAADHNRDNRITYSEIVAFTMNANAMVKDSRALLQIYYRAPENLGDAILVELPTPLPTHVIGVDLQISDRRLWISDTSGTRWIDANLEHGHAARVLLSAGRDYELFVPNSDWSVIERFEIVKAEVGPTELRLIPNSELVAKGESIEEVLRTQLFADTYGPKGYQRVLGVVGEGAFEPGPGELDLHISEADEEGSLWSSWWLWTAVGTVVAGAVIGGVLLADSGASGNSPACPSGVECR
jgi:hypothetical protein